MFAITNEAFEKIVADAIDNIPEKYAKNIKNLAFVTEDEPSQEQHSRLELHQGQTLYGLYEGIPLTRRSAGYNLVLPDKITIFKKPMEASSNTFEELAECVKHTVWHEVAHYFGLDHSRINELENNH
jgi:predicted Zn-dependent protease with MMP-like domain